MSSSLLLDDSVVKLLNGESMLDVACGMGKWAFLARTNAKFFVKHPPDKIVGVDIFRPYLNFLKNEVKVHDALVRCDIRFLPFKDKIFDIVLIAEVIEHLTKEDGEKIFWEAKRLTKKRIIFTTPQYPLPQSDLDGNMKQEHISRYAAGDFKKMGFKVRGVGVYLWHYVFPYVIPFLPLRFAYLLVAFKDI